ncbi:transposase [Streptomyces sp. NPDC059373]
MHDAPQDDRRRGEPPSPEASPCDRTPGDWKTREEFKQDVIALARSSSKTITEIARDLGVSLESLHGWVKRDWIDRGEGASDELTSTEREELRRLRR